MELDSLSARLLLIAVFLFQIVRQVGISISVYKSYNALVIEGNDALNFDVPMDYEETRRRRDATSDEEESGSELPVDPNSEVFDWLQLCVPNFEVLMSVGTLVFFMGPMSPGIPIKDWLIWLLKLRIAWMHMLWTTVAAIYVYLYSLYRTWRYEETEDTRYLDTITQQSRMWCTVVEYACLGTVQSVVEIYTLDRIERRLAKAKEDLDWLWGRLVVATYLMCTATYAMRNFSMSLYFGLLSAFVTQTEQLTVTGSQILGLFNFIVVMQIYLALMRGSYFEFFIRLFTGYFLSEAEAFKFVTRDEEEEARKSKSRRRLQGTQSKERRKTRSGRNSDAV